jgi:hypothetical protein
MYLKYLFSISALVLIGLTSACKNSKSNEQLGSDVSTFRDEASGNEIFAIQYAIKDNDEDVQFCAFERTKSGDVLHLNKMAWNRKIADLNASRKLLAAQIPSGIVGAMTGFSAGTGCVIGGSSVRWLGGRLIPVCISAGVGVSMVTAKGLTELIKWSLKADKNTKLAAYYTIAMAGTVSPAFDGYEETKKALARSGNSKTECPLAEDAKSVYDKTLPGL